MTRAEWLALARRCAKAALEVYERGDVEHELALHLARALREIDRCTCGATTREAAS